MMFTPANIVNTLCERKIGADLMVGPFLQVMFKGKKIAKLQYLFYPSIFYILFSKEKQKSNDHNFTCGKIKVIHPSLPNTSRYTFQSGSYVVS